MKTFDELEEVLKETAEQAPQFAASCEALLQFLRVLHEDAKGLGDYLPEAGEAYLADLGGRLRAELIGQLRLGVIESGRRRAERLASSRGE